MASCSYLMRAGHAVKTAVFHGTVSLSYTRSFPLVVLCNGEGAGSPDYGTVSLASQPIPPLCNTARGSDLTPMKVLCRI